MAGLQGPVALWVSSHTGDVTQEHVVEVSPPTPAALAPTTAVQPAVEPTSPSPTSRWTPPGQPRIPSAGNGSGGESSSAGLVRPPLLQMVHVTAVVRTVAVDTVLRSQVTKTILTRFPLRGRGPAGTPSTIGGFRATESGWEMVWDKEPERRRWARGGWSTGSQPSQLLPDSIRVARNSPTLSAVLGWCQDPALN